MYPRVAYIDRNIKSVSYLATCNDKDAQQKAHKNEGRTCPYSMLSPVVSGRAGVQYLYLETILMLDAVQLNIGQRTGRVRKQISQI